MAEKSNGDAPKREMSVREAGKKGGDTVRDRYGSTFYEDIGRKGGKATRDRHGVEFYESIGQKGGKVVREKYGSDFYEEIGHKGGQKVKKLIAEARARIASRGPAASKHGLRRRGGALTKLNLVVSQFAATQSHHGHSGVTRTACAGFLLVWWS
jgi:general stress protein YciG